MHSDRRWTIGQTSSPNQHTMTSHHSSLPSSPRATTTLNLPPSIPISLDGEEGAYAYSQNLVQCNSDIKPECYQPPPNRTIDSSIAAYDDAANAGSKLRKGALPSLPYQSSDYVSSSLLSNWRSVSSDRTMTRDIESRQQQQQRSSSADSVRKLVKRFFVRKLGCRTSTSKESRPLSHDTVVMTHNVLGDFDDLEACGTIKGNTKGIGDSRWDLPPNYVDMIFTRDPVTNESMSQVVEKDVKFSD